MSLASLAQPDFLQPGSRPRSPQAIAAASNDGDRPQLAVCRARCLTDGVDATNAAAA